MIPEARPEPTGYDARFVTPQEARDAIDNLQKADHAKLLAIARGFARTRLRNSVVGCGDIIQLNLVNGGRPRWRFELHLPTQTISLRPSIWRTVGCRSHFVLRRGHVHWVSGTESVTTSTTGGPATRASGPSSRSRSRPPDRAVP
jgi:hypothetical protein